MTQSSPTIGANKTGLAYRQEDNDGKKALLNHHKAGSAPSYAEAGTLWLDDAATPWILKLHDGTDWIKIGDVHATNNTFVPYNGTVQLDKTSLSLEQAGAPALTLKSTDTTTGDKGTLTFVSKNASSADKTLAEINLNTATATAGAEDGIVQVKTMRAGSAAARLKVGSGVYTNGASDNGVDSISTSKLYADSYRSRQVSIADDAAYSFTPSVTNGHFSIVTDNGNTNNRLLGAFGTAPYCVSISAGTVYAVATGALTGITGTDTKVTVSAHTDGKIYIENRAGSTLTFRISIF